MNEIRGKDWDQYWTDSAKNKGLFEIIAKFYRRYIISPTVRHYFRKYFRDEPGRVYLHAGCGSSESDNRIGFQHARFVLMDISIEGLKVARQKSKLQNACFVCGDIYNPPFKPEAIDGIWNLGVMEHFYEPEITRIFTAQTPILKPHGQCVIFWPPRYGLSVITLTSFLFVVNKFRKQPLVLYPDEVSRFWTKAWAQRLLGPAGLTVQRTHFGLRDAFTYVIMVAQKP
ncbi:MAG TPA: class I SAM-dependent methyltransferase [Verrucomicrobiae bacterium]|nr:class I SAM-dependent methyltransferase [Verrucomicrobiae bacterium]